MDVTVITPTIPERARMLAEAIATVAAQTAPPTGHLIAVDHRRSGPAELRTLLVGSASTEWVAFLDDDDLLDADHLERLAEVAGPDVDVAYSWCRLDPPGAIGDQFYNQPYDRQALRRHGIFPITVLARRAAILDCGGFRPEDRYEDWALWNRMADRGARFACLPEPTWTYRFHGRGQRTHAA